MTALDDDEAAGAGGAVWAVPKQFAAYAALNSLLHGFAMAWHALTDSFTQVMSHECWRHTHIHSSAT